jgi:hypothetical protein
MADRAMSCVLPFYRQIFGILGNQSFPSPLYREANHPTFEIPSLFSTPPSNCNFNNLTTQKRMQDHLQ